MIETTISVLIGLAVTGLTIIAYRHPDDYEKIYTLLLGLVMGGLLGMVCWEAGGTAMFKAISPYFDMSKQQQLTAALKETTLLGWPMVAIVVLGVYVILLRSLDKLSRPKSPPAK